MVQVTGNEFISLPSIDESNGNIDYLTILHMNSKGMLQMEGNPILKPYIKINNQETIFCNNLVWSRNSFWIPQAIFENKEIKILIKYLTPKNQKAIALRIEVTNKSDTSLNVECAFILDWIKTLHVVNESYLIDSDIKKKESNWNHGNTYQQAIATPLIALAMMEEGKTACLLNCGESNIYDYYLGIGYEEVSSATAAKHLKRIGFDNLYNELINYLHEKQIITKDQFLTKILNTNLLFTYFYSSGRTLDTEQLVLVTSRSPRYYVSAAYWDRDSLLWSFPALLLFEEKLCKEILKYVFKVQIKNVGEHSRFIDGSLLEPGFELDELCAPVLALQKYILKTQDTDFLKEKYIKEGLNFILEKLESKRNKNISLYETFLMPTDDVAGEKYLTYDNVLVWKSFIILSKYLGNKNLIIEASNIKKAIYKYLVKDGLFVWSSDLKEDYSIYDEPPGSLQLFPFLGFCETKSEIWKKTINLIRSENYRFSFAKSNISEIGCEHAPHPWILSLCNSLLSGNGKSAIENLKKMSMDNYIACESVDEETGECITGEAFATCAGFLSYSLNYYLNNLYIPDSYNKLFTGL